MRVLIADKLPDPSVTAIQAAGATVRLDPALNGELLLADVIEFQPEVLVVRSTRVGADVLDVGCLGLVVRAGAGVNTIDVAAAAAAGIYVANCPGKNSLAVAELTLGLLVSLDRRIPDAVADLRAGRWRKGEYSRARGLAGRRLAVLGGGGIGIAVARRAVAMDMDVIVWDRAARARPEAVAVRVDSMNKSCPPIVAFLSLRSIFNSTSLAPAKVARWRASLRMASSAKATALSSE